MRVFLVERHSSDWGEDMTVAVVARDADDARLIASENSTLVPDGVWMDPSMSAVSEVTISRGVILIANKGD
jgi:hypothetical protein